MHAMQQENIKNAHPNVEIYWHRVFEDIRPSMNRYTMFVAHQFFDSLPVHVLQVIQVLRIFWTRFVLIYLENWYSLARGVGGHKYREKSPNPI